MIQPFNTFNVISYEKYAGRGGLYFDEYKVEVNSKEYTVVVERNGNRVSVSDEPYWNTEAPIDDELQLLIDTARYFNKKAGVVITPYCLDLFDLKSLMPHYKNTSLMNIVKIIEQVDFIAVDPYIFHQAHQVLNVNKLFYFVSLMKEICNLYGKELILIKQGFFDSAEMIPLIMQLNSKLDSLGLESFVFDALDFRMPSTYNLDPIQ